MSTTPPPSLISTLRKIAALASAPGSAGEAQAARHKLEVLLAKHGLSLDALTQPEEPREYKFEAMNKRELKVLCQIIYVVTADAGRMTYKQYRFHHRMSAQQRREFYFQLTPMQHADVALQWAYYQPRLKAEWRRLVSNFVSAFVHANEIFPATVPSGDARTLTEAELANLRVMAGLMRSMESAPYIPPRSMLPEVASGQ